MSDEVTSLLKAWSDGDQGAFEQITPLVYDELLRIARARFRGERAGHTLQPTALVNEVFAKLIDADVAWQNRAHFYALCARMMRRLLINHAKAASADKRGGGLVEATLTDDIASPENAELFELNDALEALVQNDPRKAELLELSIFGGLTYQEMAEVTGLSTSTLDREIRFAKAWLKARLQD